MVSITVRDLQDTNVLELDPGPMICDPGCVRVNLSYGVFNKVNMQMIEQSRLNALVKLHAGRIDSPQGVVVRGQLQCESITLAITIYL